MLKLVYLTVILAVCHARLETHHFVHVHDDGKIIPEDIIHDVEANTVLVVVGDVSEYDNMFPTVNFHDFNTGYVVFKDIKQKICTLSLAPIPFATPEIYRLGRTNFSMEYTVTYDHTPMTYSGVSQLAGSRIADFCKDYVTFRRILHHKNRTVRTLTDLLQAGGQKEQYLLQAGGEKEQLQEPHLEQLSQAPCDHNCVWCIVHSDLDEYQSLSQRTFG